MLKNIDKLSIAMHHSPSQWKLLSGMVFFIFCAVVFQISVGEVFAETLEVLAPEADQREVIELGPNEVGELEIHLKSLGDMVGGYRLVALDDLDRQVGKNISDIHGLVKFTGMPAGRFRILVEKRRNDRGGVSTVQVGQINLSKRLKSAVETAGGDKGE